MNSVNIQIWIHVYEKYREFRRREIIYDIWGTKDPHVQASGLFFNQALNLNNWSFSAWEALKSIKWRMYQKVTASAAGAELTAGQGSREGTIALAHSSGCIFGELFKTPFVISLSLWK